MLPDPSTPLGAIVIVGGGLLVLIALRQVIRRGGLPTTTGETVLYLLAFPLLLVGAMAGAVWWVIGAPIALMARFVAATLIEGFTYGGGRDDDGWDDWAAR